MSSMLCVQHMCTYICDIYRARAVSGSFSRVPCYACASVVPGEQSPYALTLSIGIHGSRIQDLASKQPYQRTRHTIVRVRGRDGGVRACLASWSSHRLSAHHRLCLVMRCSRTGMGPMLVGSESQERRRKRTTPETSQRLVGGSPHLSQGSPAHEIQAAKRLAARCCRKCYCRAQW